MSKKFVTKSETKYAKRKEIEDVAKAVVTSSPNLSITASPISSRTSQAPEFDGQTIWSIYRTQFESAAKSNNGNNQERMAALIFALKGPAAEVLLSIPDICTSTQ